jgi:hypothetical protein
MSKITLLLFTFFIGGIASYGQYSCANAIPITSGFTQPNIVTPGAGSPGSWVTSAPNCQGTGGFSSTLSFNTTCFDDVFISQGDDYMFKYTSGPVAGETAYFEILIKTDYMGLMAFSDCNGTVISGCLSGAYSGSFNTETGTLSVTVTNLAANQTIYFGVGIWADPKVLDFDVTNFTVTPPALSTEDISQDKVKLFPNPVTNVLNISGLKEVSNIAIYNLLGQEVMRKMDIDGDKQVDVSSLSRGTYLVKINTNSKTETYKIIKE